ncbi:MAG TPA: hypothetical protein V6C97_33330, partial [Oculatellaceae cyanobacterium]
NKQKVREIREREPSERPAVIPLSQSSWHRSAQTGTSRLSLSLSLSLCMSVADKITQVQAIDDDDERLTKAQELFTKDDIDVMHVHDAWKLASALKLPKHKDRGALKKTQLDLCIKLGLVEISPDEDDFDADPRDNDQHAGGQPPRDANDAEATSPSEFAHRVAMLEDKFNKVADALLTLSQREARDTHARDGKTENTSLLQSISKSLGSAAFRTSPTIDLGTEVPCGDSDDDDDSKNGVRYKPEVLGPDIVKQIRASYPSMFAWANALMWKSFRNKREGLTLAFVGDLALKHGISPSTDFMEVLLRRLAALQLADQTNSWTTATELEAVPMSDTPIVPRKTLVAARKAAQTKLQIKSKSLKDKEAEDDAVGLR